VDRPALRSRGMLVCEFCTSDTSDARILSWPICFHDTTRCVFDRMASGLLLFLTAIAAEHFASCVGNGPAQWKRWPMETLVGLYSCVVF
jgi:hypothetical protein